MNRKIKKIETIKNKLPENKNFCFIARKSSNETNARKAGLDELNLNESRLPRAIGSITRFNANGKSLKLKHLPKENRYTHSIFFSWQPWGRGEWQSEIIDHYRDCYQVAFQQPPSLEISQILINDEIYFSSPPLNLTDSPEELIILAANLMNEIFGNYEIYVVGEEILSTNIVNVNWKFLPQGEKPYEALQSHLKATLPNNNFLPVILDRQEYITSLNPDQMYIGLGGFDDYIAYLFLDKNIVVLESIKYGNAVYIFGENWIELSKLPKKQVLENNHAKRIIHTSGWKKELQSQIN